MNASNYSNGKFHHYKDGTELCIHDSVKHIETGRTGIVQFRKSDGRILVRWFDEQGNRLRRSSVNANKLQLVRRYQKAVA